MRTLKPCFSMKKGLCMLANIINYVYHNILNVNSWWICMWGFFCSEECLGQIFHFERGQGALNGREDPSLKVIGTLWVTSKVNMTLRSSSPVVQSMWPCKLRRGWRKVKTCKVWLSKNSFGPAFVHSLLRLVKGTTKPNTLLLNGYIVWLIHMGCTYQSATYLQSQF
jgi:hypothetical protein